MSSTMWVAIAVVAVAVAVLPLTCAAAIRWLCGGRVAETPREAGTVLAMVIRAVLQGGRRGRRGPPPDPSKGRPE
jgi:hypothetical protein